MLTVADIFKRIERIKKDLEYVKSFAEKWRDQRERFPKIYEGILEQEKEFSRRIDELRRLPVNASKEAAGFGANSASSDSGDESEGRQRVSPTVSGRADKAGDKQSAAAGIEQKLRKRKDAGERAEAGTR